MNCNKNELERSVDLAVPFHCGYSKASFRPVQKALERSHVPHMREYLSAFSRARECNAHVTLVHLYLF